MDEYISREAVINITAETGAWETQNRVRELPVADVQPVKHGRWIWVKNFRDCEGDIYSQYKCSCCNFVVGSVYSINDLTHFCGNCGAKMLK